MWPGREKYQQMIDYIKPYSCYGDLTRKDNNTVAIVHALFRNGIETIEQLKALTDDDVENLSHVGPLRADIIRRAIAGGDPTVKGDFTKTLTIEYKLPFETSEEFGKWRDNADDDWIDACETCPIARICDLACAVEVALGVEDDTVGCSKLYDILLAKFRDKEDK